MSRLLPLSLAQHEVLQDQRAWPGSPHLYIGGYSCLLGPVQAELLAQALGELCDEQPALRACVSLGGNALLPTGHAELPRLQCPALAPDESLDAAARRCWQAWVTSRPDPAAAPAWSAAWLDRGGDEGAILLMAHHALLDGWGTAQLMRRWAERYSALVAGQALPVSEDASWPRHLQDSESYRQGSELARDAAFWQEELPSVPPPLFATPAPAGRPEPHPGQPRDLPASRIETLAVTQTQRRAWAAAAAPDGHTEVACFAAALAWQLGHLAGLDEVLIGVPTLNRKGAPHRAALGMYVGVFCLRIPLQGVRTPRELIAVAGQQLHRAMRHARYPLSQLARRLGLAREGRSSPFDVLLSFERQDFALRFGAAQVSRTRQLFSGRARYPLGLTVCDFGAEQDLELVVEGSPLLGDARQLSLLARRQLALVDAFAAQPEAPLEELPLLPPAEREAVIEGLHADLAQLPEPQSVVERFAAQAALHPQAPALLGEPGLLLRYGELAARVERLARRLLAQLQPLQAGDTIALALPRGPLLVTAMLAVTRAGAAFVPLDLEAPDARLQALLQQLRPRAWLGSAAEAARLAGLHPGWMAADDDAEAPALPLPPWPAPGRPAYAFFTSGSSGAPKAVLVSHGALARRFAWMAKVWDLGPADRSLQGTQPTFDPSLIELLLPLSLGASVALTAPGRSAPESWAAFALRQGCSFAALVPTTLARLLDGIEALPPAERARLRLRVACCGGEVLPPALAARWRRLTGAQLWNVYGPTEACIFASAWACRDDEDADSLPIGTPLDDTRLYVLGPGLQALPVGTPGEIWIGGAALAEGYLHDAERTAAAFRDDPFLPGGRLYRSGDRGYLDGEGRLQFLGRVDRQLKIRGQRVEPGEVEAQLLALPGVQEAAVLGVGQPLRLHAWLAPADLDLPALQALARERLPELLLPAGWTLMDALPRSRSGKLETARLPPPGAAPLAAARAPANALEQTLLHLLRETLKRPELGLDDDFFAVGGDSLAALDWLGSIEQATGLHADLGLLAQAPTVARLAERLGALAPPPASPLAVPLSEGPTAGPRLFLAASGHGDLLRFQALARALGPHCDLHMLQPPPGQALPSLDALAQAYGEHVLAAAGPGPLLLAGFSVGGVTALETARWLQAQGRPPEALLLLDTVFPRWLFRQPWLWRGLSWLTRRLYVQELSMNGRRLDAMFKDQGLVGQVLALHGYRPAAYAGPVLLLRTSGLKRWQGWLFGPWRAQLRLQEREIKGLHGSVFEAGLVGGLAQSLLDALPRPPSSPV